MGSIPEVALNKHPVALWYMVRYHRVLQLYIIIIVFFIMKKLLNMVEISMVLSQSSYIHITVHPLSRYCVDPSVEGDFS